VLLSLQAFALRLQPKQAWVNSRSRGAYVKYVLITRHYYQAYP
jgi:hypothetical protein